MALFIRLLNIESGSVCKQCSHGDYTPLNKINVPKNFWSSIKYMVLLESLKDSEVVNMKNSLSIVFVYGILNSIL